MARSGSARHARPTGRRALESAYAALHEELARARAEGFVDRLELVRVSSLADGLAESVARVTADLERARGELVAAQAGEARAAALAAQVSELRATVAAQQSSLAAQQSSLADLARRLLDLADRLVALDEEPTRPTPVLPPAPVLPPVPTAPPAYPRADLSAVGLAAPRAAEDATPEEAPAGLGDLVDDEIVARLRLIRETHGR